MQLLFRDGRMVFNNGRAVNADCPEPCCGVSALFYCKMDRCFGDPASTSCLVEPPVEGTPQTIYVAEALLRTLPCYSVSGGFVILYQGYCYNSGLCAFYDQDESISNAGVPIPDGSVIVRSNQVAEVECAVNCSDPRCNVVRWMPGVWCGCGNPPTEPVYICAGNFAGCFVKSVGGVCLKFDSGFTTTNPIPTGVFLGPSAAFGLLTCCSCCGNSCVNELAPIGDACIPWSSDTTCCCDDADVVCLREWDYKDQYFEPHCEAGAPAIIHAWIDAACATRADGQINSNFHRVRTGTFPEAETVQATSLPTYCIPEVFAPLLDPGCVGTFRQELGNGAYHLTTTTWRRGCTFLKVTVIRNQFQPELPTSVCPGAVEGRVSLRRRETFRFVYTRTSTGPCSGGCQTIPATPPSEGAATVLAGGCVGCGGGKRTEVA